MSEEMMKYKVEYEIPPLRAIYHHEVEAPYIEWAMDHMYKTFGNIRIRGINEVHE